MLVFAVIGGVMAVVEFVQFVTTTPGTVLAALSALLIFGVPIVFCLWLWQRKDYDLLRAFMGVIASVALGYVIVSSLGGDGSASDEGGAAPEAADSSEGPRAFPAERACAEVPQERSDPPLRRTCERLVLDDTTIDLDSLEPDWLADRDAPGADFEFSYGFSNVDLSDIDRLSAIEGAGVRFNQCQSTVSWTSDPDDDWLDDFKVPALCVRTTDKRIAVLFVGETPPAQSVLNRAVVYVSVWESREPR